MTTPFSIADVLAAPFPSDLRLAPDGAHAAWVVNDGGCRNLWVAPTMDGAPARALSAYLGDDGIAIGQLCWSADADAVFYTRGACLDDDVPPDPDGLAGADAAPRIWRADLDRQPPQALARGHSPAPAPVGDLLAFIHDGQVWGASINGNAQPVCWVAGAGRCSALAWSADATRLAFVGAHDDRAAIGVLDIAGMTVRWLAPGRHFDSAPVWSPDGGALAFIRQPDNPAPTYMARAAGTPWSVWTFDAASDAVRCVWRAREGDGSVFAALANGPQLLWTRCASLVFPWEGSGWLHLYAVDAAAQAHGADDCATRALTPGPGEIFAMQEDAVAGAIVCVANRDQRDGRRLWRCAIAGGRMIALSASDVVTDLPSVAGGVTVAIESDARLPPRPVVIKGRALAGAPLPARFPAAALAPPQSVSFAAADGLSVHAQLFLPAPRADGSCHPAVIHCHGGPARQMLPAWHPSEVYTRQYGLNQYLASLGYLVLSLNYRGGTGYGLAFREPPDFGAGGASEYQDVLAAAHFLRRRGDIDPRRIGIYGTSYGGLMTALALARDSGLFAAGVDCAGVADWSPAFCGAAVPATVRAIAIAAAASPLADIGHWRAPVLLIHPSADRVVPPAQTDLLARALKDKGDVDVEHIVLAGESHDLLRHASWLRYCAATAAWFEKKMAQGDDHRAVTAIAESTIEDPV